MGALTAKHLPYSPQIDGLRGLSILAVIFFHLKFDWAEGGYLGVETFFVVSGYLITSLLLVEFAFNRRLNLKRFWLNRAKRLLPLLFVVLGATVLLSLILAREYLGELLGDVAASLVYVTNWHLLGDNQAYFDAVERPSPLLHLWSLAIEEQFYLIWPPVLAWLLKKGSFKLAVGLVVIGIGLSQVIGLAAASGQGLDRAYYGTDVRMGGLMIGSLAAIFLPLHDVGRYQSVLNNKLKHWIAWLSLLALGFTTWCFYAIPAGSHWPFRGGLLIFGGATAILLLGTILAERSYTARLVSQRWLIWLGQRSYGLYLWHWVIFQFTRPGTDTALIGWGNVWIRVVISLIVTELSYRFIERVMRRPNLVTNPVRWRLASGLTAAMLTVSVVFIAKPSVLAGEWPSREMITEEQARLGELGGVEEALLVTKGRQDQSGSQTSNQPRADILITVIGDSVVLGAAKSISQELGSPLVFDAKVNRFPDDIGPELQRLERKHKLGQIVVVAVGANGLITPDHIEQTMDFLHAKQVVWVTPRGDRLWIKDSIKTIRQSVNRWPNAFEADWAAVSADKPKWFVSDGVHVTAAGAEALAKLIGEATAQAAQQISQ